MLQLLLEAYTVIYLVPQFLIGLEQFGRAVFNALFKIIFGLLQCVIYSVSLNGQGVKFRYPANRFQILRCIVVFFVCKRNLTDQLLTQHHRYRQKAINRYVTARQSGTTEVIRG